MPDSNSELVNALTGGGLLNSIAHPQGLSGNFLASYGQGQDAAGKVWQNRLAQSQQAAGEAMQGAVNPQTGELDPLAYRRNLRDAGPVAALSAQSGLGAIQSMSSDQLQQVKTKMGWIDAASGAALQSGDYSDAAMLQLMHKGLAGGVLTLPEIQRQLQTMPADPAGRQQWLREHQMTAASTQQQLDQTYGTRPAVSTGGSTEFPVVPPASSGRPGPSIPNTLSPGEGAQRVITGYGPNGEPIYGPLSTVTPGAPGGPPGPVGAPSAYPNGGRLRNPNAPPGAEPAGAAPPAPTPAPAPGTRPGEVVSPTPGTTEEATQSAAHAIAARERASGYQQRIQPVEAALGALASSTTGKGSETLNTVRAYVQDLTPGILQRTFLPATLTDPAKRAAFEEAQKYLTQMQLQAPGGARSDTGAATAGAATPSIHISNQAATMVTRAILAQHRMEQAGTLLFNQSAQPGANYDKWMNKWATEASPMAFVVDKMSGPEKAEAVAAMGGVNSQAYQRFKSSYQQGLDAGVIGRR